MSRNVESSFSREAVAVFHSADGLQGAIDELLSSGFDRAEISLLAGEDAVQEKLGHIYEKIRDAEDDPEAPRADYVSPESIGDAEGAVIGGLTYIPATLATGLVVASGGTIAAAAAAAASAGIGGALIGGILAGLIDQHHGDRLNGQLEHGGLLLWVLVRDENHEKRATAILRKHADDDVHVHGVRTRLPQENG